MNPTQNQRGNSELNSELTPCPFCGGKPEIIRCKLYLDEAVQVRCKGCGTSQPKELPNHRAYINGEETFRTEEMAIEEITRRWNRRADDECK